MNRAPSGIEACRPQSYGSIERVAQRVRLALLGPQLDLEVPLPGLALFDNLDAYCVEIPGKPQIGLDSAVANGPAEGMTVYDPDQHQIVVALTEDSYESLIAGQVRARYTLAHEVGHAVLHAVELVQLGGIQHNPYALYRKMRQHPPYRDTEWQANAFAAALLMPAAGLAQLERRSGTLTPELLSRTYGTSYESSSYRIMTFTKRRDELIQDD